MASSTFAKPSAADCSSAQWNGTLTFSFSAFFGGASDTIWSIAAIAFAALFLVLLLADIVIKALPAFTQSRLSIDMPVLAEKVDPRSPRTGDFDATAFASLVAAETGTGGRDTLWFALEFRLAPGWKTYNRRYMYAALNWCTEGHSAIIDALRELLGGGVFQMPADISLMQDPKLREQFETYWQTPQLGAVERMKLYKLAWDLVGSEFAGRHTQYEKFYAGASFIVRNHSFREAPWAMFHGVVDGLLASYDVPAPTSRSARASS